MSTFDIAILIGGICGLCMVVGGMILLYKGAITLKAASEKEAVSIEFKKILKLSTHYPALGLFIIGLVFIVCSIHFSKPPEYTIEGKIKGIENLDSNTYDVTIGIPDCYVGESYARGEILAKIQLTTDILEIRFSRPGYEGKPIPIKTKKNILGKIDLGEIFLADTGIPEESTEASPEIEPSPDLILNTTEELPSIEESGTLVEESGQ